MCGRYAVYSSPDQFAKYFSAKLTFKFGQSYNIAPSTMIPVVIKTDSERLIVPMRWGLIPSWYKDGQKLALLNNAKMETVDSKPSFRVPFRRHRCLILADGFYEWDSSTKPKQPYYFHMKDLKPIAMAGIWDNWESPDGLIASCCIITTGANKIVGKVHDRMPVILSKDNYDRWLDPSLNDASEIKPMLDIAVPSQSLVVIQVTTKVNKTNFDSPECIQQIK